MRHRIDPEIQRELEGSRESHMAGNERKKKIRDAYQDRF
jgi:hypothetical protein